MSLIAVNVISVMAFRVSGLINYTYRSLLLPAIIRTYTDYGELMAECLLLFYFRCDI